MSLQFDWPVITWTESIGLVPFEQIIREAFGGGHREELIYAPTLYPLRQYNRRIDRAMYKSIKRVNSIRMTLYEILNKCPSKIIIDGTLSADEQRELMRVVKAVLVEREHISYFPISKKLYHKIRKCVHDHPNCQETFLKWYFKGPF